MHTNRSLVALLALTLVTGCASPQPEPQPRNDLPPPDHERRIEPSPNAGGPTSERHTTKVLDAEPAYDPWPQDEEVAPVGPRPTVSINRGQGGGVAQGEQYDVFCQGEALVDPDTGEVLGAEEVKVGRITITQVLQKFSKARLDGGAAQKGDVCRPAQGPAMFSPHPGASAARPDRAGKATMAIAPFDFHRDVRAIPGADLETDTFTQKFVTGLVQTRKFDVVERSKLERLMAEHDLGQSGMVDPARAAQARLLGADFFVMGEISVWTLTTEVRPVPHTDRFLRQSELRLIVDFRIVDTETSKVVSAEKGDVAMPWKEMFRGRPPARQALDPARLDEVQRLLVDQLVQKTIDAVYPIKVIAVSGQAARPAAPPRDTTPPQVRILAPRDGQVVTGAPVNVVVEASDDRELAQVTINGARASRDAQGRYRVRISSPRTGPNLVRAQATDAAGNSAEATAQFTFATPPEVDGEANILVEGTVDDPSATVTVNGVRVEVDANGRYSARVPADPEDPGRITIVATDQFGNESRQIRRVR